MILITCHVAIKMQDENKWLPSDVLLLLMSLKASALEGDHSERLRGQPGGKDRE